MDAYKRSLRLNPRVAAAWIGLAEVLDKNQQYEDSIGCLKHAVAADRGNAKVLSKLARAQRAGGQLEEASRSFDQALSINPQLKSALIGLGGLHEEAGDPVRAAERYRQVLKIDPKNAEALGAIVGLVRDLDVSAEIKKATLAMAEADDHSNSIIGYGLGRALESLNRFEEAFITMASANKARRNAAGAFSRQQFDQRLLLLKQIFTRDFFTARNQWGYQSDVPVFVVGLPRSGTTLTEQIISSHPNCFGGGELASLTDLATGTPDRIGSTKRLWPDSATLLSASHVEQLGREYMVRVLGLADGNYRRIVDKQPLNFWHLGLVALALPQAKVIHCVRDVRDNGLSIFAQNFNAQQKWSTDLSDIAHYWRGYRTIMEHWKSVTDLEILDVQYEETVGDLEYQARRILKFLDVPWAPGVLEFHKNRRAVQTPSRWQVRQPIYSTSKSKWKLYERHLGPLISAAAEQGRSL